MREVASLVPYARNARTHSPDQVAQIARSIQEFGFTNPVLVDGEGGIVAGHGRVMAAKSLGVVSIPVLRVDWLTDAQRRAYVLADNQLALNAGWDENILASELKSLRSDGFALDKLGFSDEALDGWFGVSGADEKKDVNDAPRLEETSISVIGDVWRMGNHALLCGDCTDVASMGRLMGREFADCVWTDPPYNVNYGDKAEALDKINKGHRNIDRILNDNMPKEEFTKFLGEFYRSAYSFMKPGAAIYIAHSESEREAFTANMTNSGFKLSGVVIWRKNNLVLGRSDYQWSHEPILYGWKEGKRIAGMAGEKKQR